MLPTLYPGIGLGGPAAVNPIGTYFGALDALRPYADYEACPGHGYRFTGLASRIDRIEEHHRHRAREVQSVRDREPGASVWEVSRHVTWKRGWDNLPAFLQASALRQVEMHLQYLDAPDANPLPAANPFSESDPVPDAEPDHPSPPTAGFCYLQGSAPENSVRSRLLSSAAGRAPRSPRRRRAGVRPRKISRTLAGR